MSQHDHVENNPMKEFTYALVFLAMFAGIAGLIFFGGYTRPAAPKNLAETKAIIGLDEKPAAAVAPATATAVTATATPAAVTPAVTAAATTAAVPAPK